MGCGPSKLAPTGIDSDYAIVLTAKETRTFIKKLNAKLKLRNDGRDVLSAPPSAVPQSVSNASSDGGAPAPSPYTTLYAGLLESVRTGAIKPLRGRFVKALHKHGGRLRRRQDLPPEAFWTYEELKAVAEKLGERWYGWLFVALSYRWLSADHPDPDGFHLAIIAEVAALYLKDSMLTFAFEKAGLDRDTVDFALFWDFGSLTQKPRTETEELLFMPGLRASNIWYGHLMATCWQQTTLPKGFSFAPFRDNKTGEMRTPAQTYEDSGWCFIESIISAGIKVGVLRLDLGQRTEEAMGKGYGALVEVCAAKQPPPILPGEAARLLREVKVFTAGSDVDKVIELYRSFFEGVSQSAKELNFYGLEWGDAEAVQLAAVLPSFVRLEKLFLSGNKIGEAGMAALAEACRHLPQLEELNLENNQIGDAGAAALAEACRQLPNLKELGLIGNQIGDAGAAALAEACRQLPTLEKLDLENNQIGDAGAAALAEACRQLPNLKELGLIGNQIGDAGAAALAQACRQLPTLEKLDLDSNQIGDAGMAALAEAIAKEGAFPSLTRIYLGRNFSASDEAQKAVYEALKKKKSKKKRSA